VNKKSAKPGRLLSQYPGTYSVHSVAEFTFHFGPVHCRVGAGVDYDRRLDPSNQVPNRMLATEIALSSTDRKHIVRGVGQAGELGPYLSGFTGNQDSHAS
jgi:hypothetical protein